MQITFDPYNHIEREFVSSVLTTLTQNSDASGLASVGPEAAASGEELVPSSSPDSCSAEPTPVAEGEPAKRKRRTKAEMEAARAAEAATAATVEPAEAPNPFEDAAAPTQEPQPAPMPEPTHAPSYDTYTQEQVRAALQRYTSIKGLTAGIDLLNTFDVKRISDLNPMFYADLIAKCAV